MQSVAGNPQKPQSLCFSIEHEVNDLSQFIWILKGGRKQMTLELYL